VDVAMTTISIDNGKRVPKSALARESLPTAEHRTLESYGPKYSHYN
jgi:hypothetical protein